MFLRRAFGTRGCGAAARAGVARALPIQLLLVTFRPRIVIVNRIRILLNIRRTSRSRQKCAVLAHRPPAVYCALAAVVVSAGAASERARVAQLVPAAEIHWSKPCGNPESK